MIFLVVSNKNLQKKWLLLVYNLVWRCQLSFEDLTESIYVTCRNDDDDDFDNKPFFNIMMISFRDEKIKTNASSKESRY